MKPNNSICLLALVGVLSALLLNPAQAQPPEPQASNSEPPAPEPPGPEPEQDNTDAETEVPRFQSRDERERELQVNAHPEQARLLTTLEGEVLALYLPPLTSAPKGALLLPYTGARPGDCPPAWDYLRRSLPHYGWGTMLVALPPATPAAVPPRPAPAVEILEKSSDEQIAPVPSIPAIPRAQRIASRLDAAISQLEQEGQLNLVVMVDNLSARAAITHLKSGLKVVEVNAGDEDNQGQSPLEGPVRAVILANIHPTRPFQMRTWRRSFQWLNCQFWIYFWARRAPLKSCATKASLNDKK